MTRTSIAWRWLVPALLICLFVFAESSREAPSIERGWVDDMAHIVAHFLLFGSISFCLARAFGYRSWKASVIVVALTVLYGFSDELHQSFVPARDASLGDIEVDAIGALVGTLSAQFVSRPKVRRNTRRVASPP